MADITDMQDLSYTQIESVDNPNPRLASPTTEDSLVFNLTAPIFDEDGVIPTKPFVGIFLNAGDNAPLAIYVDPSTELSADGKVITLSGLTQKGIAPAGENGIDFFSGTAARRFDLQQNSTYRGSVSALSQKMLSETQLGHIGSSKKWNTAPLWDITKPNVASSKPVYADAATGEAAISSPVNGYEFYATAEGVTRKYEGGTWINAATGSTVNASETVAGKVEKATEAEGLAGTQTGTTGAELFMTPDRIAKVIQNASWSYAADAEASDAYAITLAPAIAATAIGQIFTFTANTANTGASTLNVNAKGAKALKKYVAGSKVDTETNDIPAGIPLSVFDDGTDYVILSRIGGGMSTVDATTLTDGSNADSLHVHDFTVAVKSNASGSVLWTDATEYSTASTSYISVSSTKVLNRPGTVTISFEQKASDATGTTFKINWTDITGTSQFAEISTTSASYVTKTQDIDPLIGTDITFELKSGASATGYVQNISIKGDEVSSSDAVVL